MSLSCGRFSAELIVLSSLSEQQDVAHTLRCILERDRTLRSSHEFAELGCDASSNLCAVDIDVVNHELSLARTTLRWLLFGREERFCAV